LLFNVEAFKTLSQVVLSPISRNSKTALYRIFFDVGLNLSASDKRDPTTCEYQITGLIGNIATWDRHMAEYGDMMRYWCDIDAVLMRYWCSIDAVLMRYWCSIDAILMRYWCSIDAILMQYWCSIDVVLT
jgi:hypothetical protein